MSSDAEKKNGENTRQRKNMNTSDTDLTRIAEMTGSDLILLGETMKGTIQWDVISLDTSKTKM